MAAESKALRELTAILAELEPHLAICEALALECVKPHLSVVPGESRQRLERSLASIIDVRDRAKRVRDQLRTVALTTKEEKQAARKAIELCTHVVIRWSAQATVISAALRSSP
jgi:hypothetical protein